MSFLIRTITKPWVPVGRHKNIFLPTPRKACEIRKWINIHDPCSVRTECRGIRILFSVLNQNDEKIVSADQGTVTFLIPGHREKRVRRNFWYIFSGVLE
jgi:hypothetical protein